MVLIRNPRTKNNPQAVLNNPQGMSKKQSCKQEMGFRGIKILLCQKMLNKFILAKKIACGAFTVDNFDNLHSCMYNFSPAAHYFITKLHLQLTN